MVRHPRSTAEALLATLLLLLLPGCGGDDGSGPAVDGVTIVPGTTELTFLGETASLEARVTDAAGGRLGDAEVGWSSSAPGVASVDGEGVVTAVSEGSATITATSGGVSGTATVTVDQRAATVVVMPAADTVDAGSSVQLSAEATDQGGAEIGTATVQWSSSDEALATVTPEGVVEASRAGEVVITASVDGVSGTAEVTVERADLRVTENTTLPGGTMEVDTFTVAEGVTLTLAGDAVIDATGPMTLAGEVTGDCVGLELITSAELTITADVGVACSGTPPADVGGLTLIGESGVEIRGARVEASSTISVWDSRDGDLANRRAGSPDVDGSSGRLQHTSVQIVESDFVIMPRRAPQERAFGGDVDVAAVTVIIEGARLMAQHGFHAPPVSNSGDPAVAEGKPGGRGGFVSVNAVSLLDYSGEVLLAGGDGGEGGDATATAVLAGVGAKAPDAVATGGEGGAGGKVFVPKIGEVQEIRGNPEERPGTPGRGGDAVAVGADGAAATPETPAQVGGDATAKGGSAGELGVVVDGSNIKVSGPARGGNATATAGDGGDGHPLNFRDGADGGNADARGGAEPAGRYQDWPHGSVSVAGGNGGQGAGACFDPEELKEEIRIQVERDEADSDEFIFDAETGLVIEVSVLLEQPSPGGRGGNGGAISYDGAADLQREFPATQTVTNAGNGGRGGLGAPPGEGGSAGGRSGTGGQVTGSFQAGARGPECATPPPSRTVALGPRAADGTRTVTFTADAPWVAVTGTLQEDGTFFAEGRGTVAGVDDVLVDFEGTFDPETGDLSGLYRMDVEAVIVPGHPVVYRVDSTEGS